MFKKAQKNNEQKFAENISIISFELLGMTEWVLACRLGLERSRFAEVKMFRAMFYNVNVS